MEEVIPQPPTPPTPELDKLKLMYDNNYDELNRCRDWPIKVLAFTSALNLVLIGFLNINTPSNKHLADNKSSFITIIIVFSLFTVGILWKQHIQYLKYRNIQVRLQNLIGIYEWQSLDKHIYPKNVYGKILDEKITTNFLGFLFYAAYVAAFAIITVCIIYKSI